jgi:sulfur carrier protein ThiS
MDYKGQTACCWEKTDRENGRRCDTMIEITFNAFSFLRAKLKRNNIDFINARLELPEDSSAGALIEKIGLSAAEVEGVFVNNKIVPRDTVLKQGDRVALVPPGTPGPYRVMLGMVAMKKTNGACR